MLFHTVATKFLHNEPTVPTWREWDPSLVMLQKNLIDCVHSEAPTTTIRLLVQAWCPDIDNPSAWKDQPFVKRVSILFAGFLLLLFWCMCFLAMILWCLHLPVWHVCVSSGSYLVWREVLALPLRRRFLQKVFLKETTNSSKKNVVTATASYRIPTDSTSKAIKDLVWDFEIPREMLCGSTEEEDDDDFYLASVLPMEVEGFCTYGERDKEGRRLDENGNSIESGDTLDVKLDADDLDRAREQILCTSLENIHCTVVPEYVLENELDRIAFVPEKFAKSLLLGLFRMVVGTLVYIATIGHLIVYCLFKVFADPIRRPTTTFCDPLSSGHTSVFSVWSVGLCHYDNASVSMYALQNYFGFFGAICLIASALGVVPFLMDKRIKGAHTAKWRRPAKGDSSA